MPRAERRWVRALSKEEKITIAAVCDEFIARNLKSRFPPKVRPTEFNYPVDIYGRWRGSKYGFITRYRSGFPENLGDEFDSPFVRLDHREEHLGGTRFSVMWLRHTGKWWCLYSSATLEEALRLIETDELLWPVC